MAVRLSGLMSNMDTDSIVKELMKAQRMKQTKVENKKTKLEWTQDKWKELNTKIYKFYTDSVWKLKSQGSYQSKTVSSSDSAVATATAGGTAASGAHTLEVTQLASSQYVTGKKLADTVSTGTKLKDIDNTLTGSTITFKAGSSNAVSFTVGESDTVNTFISKAKDAGLNASFDTTQKRFFISSKESGIQNKFSVTSTGSLSGLGLLTINPANAQMEQDAETAGVSYVAAADAAIKLDGAALTGSTNSFSAAGITFNLVNKTAAGQSIKINVSDNTQATYDMVKGFITDYNSLLKEMNTLYNAKGAKGYEPLTDEQKESMTDDQIEKWETKIKESLLRRDDSLGSLTNEMKEALSSSVTVDGKKYSLSSYGIMTSTDYSERGLLHIYGDSTDSTFSSKADKLKAALNENPDQVAEVLSGIATELYTSMQDKMKTSSLKSALSFYNDKQITKQLNEYKGTISKWEDRLQDMEDRYYKQFTAMEKAMSKLNSQSSYLSGLMG